MKHIGRILLLLTIVSCERQSEDFYLHFENTGDKHICIDYDLGYPVDSLKVIKNIMDPHNPCYEIAPKTEKVLKCGVGKYESWYTLFNISRAGYISFAIMDKIIKDEGDMETVQNEYCILVRYDVTREDLETLGFRLAYPPTKEMAQIHMYPPYNTFVDANRNLNRMLTEN